MAVFVELVAAPSRFSDRLWASCAVQMLASGAVLALTPALVTAFDDVLQVAVAALVAINALTSLWSRDVRGSRTLYESAMRAALGFSGGLLVFTVLFVLFGAPLASSFGRTLGLAAVAAALTTLPAAAMLGRGGARAAAGGDGDQVWVRVFANAQPRDAKERWLFYTASLSLLGAWLGAFTLPLDWDREWQFWPLPCLVGALLGHVIGAVLVLLPPLVLPAPRRAR